MSQYREDWDEIRKRYEAFWRGDVLDRPLVRVTAPPARVSPPLPEDTRPTEPEALLRWYTDPDLVIPRLERNIARTYYAGDAFPTVFPVSLYLVAIQAAYLGGHYAISPANGSGWCDPIIEDWNSHVPFRVDASNDWWRRTLILLEKGAAAFAGRAAVGIPDLQGGGQILDGLRGTEPLAIDLIEHPEEVDQALAEIDDTWLEYWKACNRLILPHQAGYVDSTGLWSDRPYVTVECDFSCMISAEMFNRFFLPSVRRQTGWMERTIYHLDGPDALRHLDALLSLDTLDAIQWVPGAGAPPMREWIHVLRRIQDAGKFIEVMCGSEEVAPLLAALRPEGLCFTTWTRTAEEADRLVRQTVKGGSVP